MVRLYMCDTPEDIQRAAEYQELVNLLRRAQTEGQLMPPEDRKRLSVLQTKLFLIGD